MAQTREEIEAAWWERWRAEDFSWVGLAGKPVGRNGRVVHGGVHGERTLQEYWRRDPATGVVRGDAALEAAGELMRAPDGALWHLAHVPLVWADGTAGRAGWSDAARAGARDVVLARMAAAVEMPVDWRCNAKAPDSRAQLQGVVLVGG